MTLSRKALWDGVMAGLLGGTVLIIVFLFLDLARGQPLHTPTFLSGALLGQMGVEGGSLRIALYTAAHYVAFLILGIGASLLFEVTRLPKNLLLGAAYGLFACSLVFYPSLVLSGTDILAAPAWPAVFFGNVLAGLVIVGYLHWTSPEPGVTGVWAQLMAHRTLREGIVAGLLGAFVVAVWFLIVDSVAGRPLFTPAALGSAIFHGTDAARNVDFAAATILGYTLIHLAAFLVFGVIVSGLVTQAERTPPILFLLLLMFVVVQTFFIAMVVMLGNWILEQLAWWSVLLGNVIAAFTVGVYMWNVHPGLREKLKDEVLWAEE
ncbi:MAG: hypothetical protein ACE5JR_02120 [Gemmatimonadota bacterium]